MSNSMVRAISSFSVANKALMAEHTSNNKVWLFVEGICDAKVYNKFVDQQVVKISIAGDKPNTIKALGYYLKHRKSKLGIAIVDSDHDHILSIPPVFKELFFTDCSDLIVQSFETSALTYTLNHAGHMSLKEDDVRRDVYAMLSGLAHLRLINNRHNLEIDFTGNVTKLFGISDSAMVTALMKTQQKRKISDEDLKKRLAHEKKSGHANHFICQGHDLCKGLSLFLRTNGGSNANSGAEKIEDNLLAAYDSADFKKSILYKNICAWAAGLSLNIFKI